MPEDPLYTTCVKEKYTIDTELIQYPCSMYLDQATHTGICIYDNRKRLVTTMMLTKDKRQNIIEFRSEFRKELQNIIEHYKIDKIFCEDVFGGVNFDTTQKLISVRDNIVDIAYENNIKAYPLDNTKWKSRLAHPEGWRQHIDDKEQIKMHVDKYYPLNNFEPDVYDAVGMAIAVLFKTDPNIRPLTMQLDKKLRIDTLVRTANFDFAEDLEQLINETKYKRKLGNMEYKLFDYDTTLDLNTNFRYILTNYDVIAITKIPYHRYYGQILLDYDIRPMDIAETDVLIGIATKK